MSPPRLATGSRTLMLATACAALVTACGSGGQADTASGAPLLAALGDSITAGSPAWDPNPDSRQQLGTGANPESQYEYWAQLALPGAPVFRNCGVSGERTDQIAARLPGCARGARVVVVQGGINDIAQGRPVTAAAASLEGIVRAARRGGRRVLVTEVLPWNNGSRRAAAQIVALNALIAAIGRREGVPVVPFYRALEDPRRPARMRADLTADGDHPSVAGYRILGRLVAAELRH